MVKIDWPIQFQFTFIAYPYLLPNGYKIGPYSGPPRIRDHHKHIPLVKADLTYPRGYRPILGLSCASVKSSPTDQGSEGASNEESKECSNLVPHSSTTARREKSHQRSYMMFKGVNSGVPHHTEVDIDSRKYIVDEGGLAKRFQFIPPPKSEMLEEVFLDDYDK